MGLFDFFKSRPDQIMEKYYKDYPRKPYISPDRDFDDWELKVKLFPQMIVQKEMMTAFSDGLLPGHVYMLHWIDKIHHKRIPEYFEYEYGIDFGAEKMFLRQNGYLADDTVTEKGRQAIQTHNDVILAKHPEPVKKEVFELAVKEPPARTIPQREIDSIENIPEEDFDQLKAELRYLNKIVKAVSEKYSFTVPSIQFSRLVFGTENFGTHYAFAPKTKTGRPAKHPLTVRYSYKERKVDVPAIFGTIQYLQNGFIGSTSQIYWVDDVGYFIDFARVGGKIVLKRVEKSIPKNGIRTLIYRG